MTRFCVKCGYDVSAVPVQDGHRRCPECGALGRGVRPWRGFRRALRRALLPGLVLWGFAATAIALEIGGFIPLAGPSGRHGLFPVLAAAAAVVSIVEPIRVARKLGPRAWIAGRRRWQALVLAISWGTALPVAAGLTACFIAARWPV